MMWGAGLVVAVGAALVALGAWAALLRPRRVTTMAFAVYALVTGAYWIVFYSPRAFPDAGLPTTVPASLNWTLSALGWVCLPALALGVPRPLVRSERALLVRPILGAALFIPLVVLWPNDAWRALGWTTIVTETAIWGAAFFAIGLAIERFRSASGAGADGERAHISLLVVALALVNGVATGSILADTLLAAAPLAPLAYGSTAYLLALVAAWLVVAARAPAPATRQARDLALLSAGAFALGGISSALLSGTPADSAALGLVLLASGILLARGALVGGLLGRDVALRFAISKSTIAAVFIAVFFVASEAAQQFFGATFQSAYVGIAAAGALVFVMAPLQRAAERLAERAVPAIPEVATRTPVAAEGRRRLFADAVRRSLRDGAVSREEEAYLARLATELGLDYATALSVKHDVEAEPAAGGP